MSIITAFPPRKNKEQVMSKNEIQRLYNDLGIGDESERRRYEKLARMGQEGVQAPAPRLDSRQWLRWDNTCGPSEDEDC